MIAGFAQPRRWTARASAIPPSSRSMNRDGWRSISSRKACCFCERRGIAHRAMIEVGALWIERPCFSIERPKIDMPIHRRSRPLRAILAWSDHRVRVSSPSPAWDSRRRRCASSAAGRTRRRRTIRSFWLLAVTITWQLAFLLIRSNPVRFRLLMLPAIVEKLGYVTTLIVI